MKTESAIKKSAAPAAANERQDIRVVLLQNALAALRRAALEEAGLLKPISTTLPTGDPME